MNKKVSRRQLLTALATAAGGVGLLWARRFLTTQAARDLDPTLTHRIYLPLVSCQPNIYDSIRQEALAPNSETNHPLPLIGSWNASTWWNYDTDTAGFYPGWQLEMVDQGHHLLPWFNTPYPDPECEQGQFCTGYFESPIKKAAQLNLPISFVGTQWEHYLYDDPAYFNLPPNQNPNVVSPDGTVQKMISPFGPVNYWYEVGKRWGSSSLMQQVISWYPTPPLVIFVSNNEAIKLTWLEAEVDQHYIDLYGYGRDDNFKRQVFADGWQERYSALIQGFRDGLGNPNWQAGSKFIAFEAFGPGFFGRWDEWKEYSLYVPNRIDPNPLYWQGGSPALYIWATFDERDNNVMGPLFQAMNWVFILNEAHQLNPSFWYEFISWDEDQAGRDKYAQLGQSFTPERYGGFVQFGMWLVRPRIVREYRDWDQGRAEILPWFMPVINAVDRIYTNAVLQSFWRNSTLVANTSRQHPYQSDIPPEYSTVNRMFLLNTNLDPAQPWSLDTEFPVMSLARAKGTSPNRQWLLYAYAPLGSKTNVRIAIPEYQTVTVHVALEGSFYLVDESTQNITPVTDH
jgi:hypothetical protein